MDSQPAATITSSPELGQLVRIAKITREASRFVCIGADGREFGVSRLVGLNVNVGDEILLPAAYESAAQDSELYIRKSSRRGADIYQAHAGYATRPKLDKNQVAFVRAEVRAGGLGIEAIHLPCAVIRDYFFSINRSQPWSCQSSFYQLLHLPSDVPFKDLRLGYRVRRMELERQGASKFDLSTLERAYNMLADPRLRTVYDEVRRDPATALSIPYGGFGSLLLEGERSKEGDVFFARQILAFQPERRHRTVPVPLRKLDFFADYAILRDHRRKLEILIDHQLLPLRWDPSWSQWRHLITSSVEVSADFVRTGRYRRRGGEWKLIEWETALPSRTELELPEGLEGEILKARQTHTRFGQYWKQIDRLRDHVESIPTEREELGRMAWGLGLPGDFDVTQLTWRPGYDPYYYDQLSKRSRAVYLFREEYIFLLERALVVEIPHAGHATYVFAKPADVHEWVWKYAKTTRQDIRLNRRNVAESLGFLGRLVHGKSKEEWERNLGDKVAESPTAQSRLPTSGQ